MGCGNGRLTNFLSDRTKAKIYGYEIDKETYQIANQNKNHNVKIIFERGFKGVLGSVKVENESFDLVVSSGVLHHSKNPIEKSIKEHARVIRKGGYFFVFIVGTNGTQLKMWEFCRNLLEDVDINYVFNYWSSWFHWHALC